MPDRRAAKKTDDAQRAKPRTPAAPSAAKAPATAAPASLARAVDPAELSAASPAQVRQLNRAIGNRALNRLLTNKTIQAKLTVGPADDRFEREADQAAAAVMRQAQTPAAAQPGEDGHGIQRLPQPGPSVGLEGGEVGGDIEARLSATRGSGQPLPDATRAQMETGLGADFGGVRVHTDSAAHDLNRELGAQAFTHGADVYMASGKYSPGSSDGQRLLAHELTHVVQQGASTVRRRARRPAAASLAETTTDGVIHRKLNGTTEALAALGGTPSTKSKLKAKLSGVKNMVGLSNTTEGSGKYAQIIDALSHYEDLEARYLAKNQPNLTEKEKSELWGELKQLELLTEAWLTENQDQSVAPQEASQRVLQLGAEAIKGQETLEQKRYHALRLLLPRLRHEQMEIVTNRFYKSRIYSDQTLTNATDDAFGGKVNRLDRVTHGDQEGVFMQDKTWFDEVTVGTGLGISVNDPNAGARAVAMYELARLLDLGMDVIAQTEFATHTSDTNLKGEKLNKPIAKMGVRQAMASGREAAETPLALTNAEAQQRGGGTVSLEDPVLQRALNALQLIDAIAGQIDRHWHNYYIATDPAGKVTGVIGIDLDMAFAPDHKTVLPATENKLDPLSGSHFVGMPSLVDSDFAQKIVILPPKQVENVVSKYLTPAEVAATLERFALVQEACRGILERNEAILPGAWNAQTANAQLTQGSNATYLGKMAAGKTKHELIDPATQTITEHIKESPVVNRLGSLMAKLEPLVWSGVLTIRECLDLLEVLIANCQAVESPARVPLLNNLKAAAVSNWNTLLKQPPANPGVLLKTA